jgi:hypothetical protein
MVIHSVTHSDFVAVDMPQANRISVTVAKGPLCNTTKSLLEAYQTRLRQHL